MPEFVDGGMIVALHLIGERQVARIEYPHLCAEQDQQSRRFLGYKPAERAFAQRPIEQQDARRWLIVAHAGARPGDRDAAI